MSTKFNKNDIVSVEKQLVDVMEIANKAKDRVAAQLDDMNWNDDLRRIFNPTHQRAEEAIYESVNKTTKVHETFTTKLSEIKELEELASQLTAGLAASLAGAGAGAGSAVINNISTANSAPAVDPFASFGNAAVSAGGTSIVLSNESEFNAIRNNLDANYDLQGATIELSEHKPIGDVDNPFTGSIKNGTIKVDRIEGTYHTGLFGVIGPDALIEDLKIYATSIKGNGFVGAIAGLNSGTIRNIEMDILSVMGEVQAGAVAGFSEGRLENINVNALDIPGMQASIEGESLIGGLIGAGTAIIDNCHVSGIKVIGDNITGGLVAGYNGKSITNSSFTGYVDGDYMVGGLVGDSSESDSVISNSTVTAKIGGTSLVGGIAGATEGSIDNCTIAKESEILGDRPIGSIAGALGAGGSVNGNSDLSNSNLQDVGSGN